MVQVVPERSLDRSQFLKDHLHLSKALDMHDDLTDAEFAMLEAPLMQADRVLTDFASEIGGYVQANYHGSPSRTIIAPTSVGGLIQTIQFVPVISNVDSGWIANNFSYHVVTHSWKDVVGGRLIKSQDIQTLGDIPENEGQIREILRTAISRLIQLHESDLQFVPNPYK